MSGFFPSLARIGSYRSVPYAFAGLVMAAPVSPFAFAVAVSFEADSRLRAVVAAVALAVLMGLLGLLGPVRRLGVHLANGLLGLGLPAPARRPDAGSRLRAGLWFALHTAVSGALATALGFLAITMFVPLAWLTGGQARISFFWDDVPLGAWTIPFGLAMLAAALVLAAVATIGFRVGATTLLGPSAAELAAAAEQRAAVLAQRNRLARELHDSIGHTLTTSTIQAAAAADLVETDPAQARRALGTIEEASRSALEDLDHVLGLLREEPAAKAPTRTLGEVDVLAVRAREAGLDVRLTVTGPVAALPATVSREGYRIVQEGLTNALRHAGPGAVDVRVEAGPDRLGIAVVNALPGDGPRTGRRGLTGLAERVEALRGELDAGPDGQQWRLRATIPLRAGA